MELDPGMQGEVFKLQLYSLTGVPPERQKILVKGGQLKDDTDLSKIGAKPGQTFMMMGTRGEVDSELQRPKEAIKFVEDMTEAEAAEQVGAIPAGLQNLGNTCYLNSTLQTLRAVPELQEYLATYQASTSNSDMLRAQNMAGLVNLVASSDLVLCLRDLFQQMSKTQQGFPPHVFLHTLRTIFPQFAERAKSGNGYAQQDAEEAWSQIIQQLREKLKIEFGGRSDVSFVDTFMAGCFASVIECDEAVAKEAGEEVTLANETFLKLDCHIDASINHLRDGILAGLEQKLDKYSSVLGRDTTYTKKSKISKLPKYLTVHFVRFFWKRESQKKVKIMRRVSFPEELDAVEFCTDELQKAMIPVRDKVRDIRKDEEDMERVRKRQKRIHEQRSAQEKSSATESSAAASTLEVTADVQKRAEGSEIGSLNGSDRKKVQTAMGQSDNAMGDVVYKTDAEVEAERASAILAAKKELHLMINPEAFPDEAANRSGLYELRGIVTHQGASADSGHYTSYVKKQGPIDPQTGQRGEEDGKWWWFNDDKVSEVEAEKINTLAGGGESHSALILLYRAIQLPDAAGIEQK